MRKNISIIGIGEVGSAVANLLLTIPKVSLNLCDIHDIQGRVLDLKHAAAFYDSKVSFNNKKDLSVADLIIYTAGYCNKQNESRNTVAGKNKTMIEEIFKTCSFQNHPLIISVTNPVELSSAWIQDVVKETATVIGTGTSLDTIRLNYLLDRDKRKSSHEKIEVIGEHGSDMKPRWGQIDASKINKDEVLAELKQSAFEIRKTEAATKYGVAHVCLKMVQAIISGEEFDYPFSVKLNDSIKKDLGIESNIFLSLPSVINKTGLHIKPFNELSDEEKIELSQVAKKIEKLYIENLTT